METKICSKCNCDQIIDNFSFKNKINNKRHNICKKCKKEYNKEHYKDNKNFYLGKAKTNNKTYKERNNEFISGFKEGKSCFDCKNYFPHYVMDFDHLPNYLKKENLSKMKNSSCSISSLKEEIAKCELVCANCHRVRTWNRKD